MAKKGFNKASGGGDSSKKEASYVFKPESKDVVQALAGANGRENLDLLGQILNVQINLVGGKFTVRGAQAAKTVNVLKSLAATVASGAALNVDVIREHANGKANDNAARDKSFVTVPGAGVIEPRNDRQKEQVLSFRQRDITLATGEAGTGKTYLSVMLAVEALESGACKSIVLVRPAVEAGEKLGFLPGDMKAKVDMYMRPIYDALSEVYDPQTLESMIEDGVIEVTALAYTRGRSIKDSVIILDESQNTTVGQLKMLLTRIDRGSKAIITGDPSQVDLPRHEKSGLVDLIERMKHANAKPSNRIGFVEYKIEDVVRHPVVQEVLDLYALDTGPDTPLPAPAKTPRAPSGPQ